jgi:acyl-coenzyme A synthetase/AMP-(fatty) acid ligase
VEFLVDADGMLTVHAKEEHTGIEARTEVKPSYGLSEDDIERMLEDSIDHAETDVDVRLLIEARVEADGSVTLLGRGSVSINSGGEKVFPEEVETILIKHPAIAQAAVIGVADAQKGEVVRAFIVRKPGQSLEADGLLAWSKENMASYKAPREVRFIDALPATGAGKVLRRLLRDIP